MERGKTKDSQKRVTSLILIKARYYNIE